MQLTGTDESPSRPRGKGATTSVRRAKAQAVEAAGGLVTARSTILGGPGTATSRSSPPPL
ncbi:hypothetical protein A2U01_0087708 [Trifolium medium]|uniref:Uncharacterized protein n=1 Tax=Trifolium medium TaxID=97028 RepID=A0A392U1U8_9FABA|nr:hypothetical protein [Trifolium medium]